MTPLWIEGHFQRRRIPVRNLSNLLKTKRGLVLGGGEVVHELTFTLPSMLVSSSTMPEVREQYRRIITGALRGRSSWNRRA